eukprot:2283542-Amphidinium_carterae.1
MGRLAQHLSSSTVRVCDWKPVRKKGMILINSSMVQSGMQEAVATQMDMQAAQLLAAAERVERAAAFARAQAHTLTQEWLSPPPILEIPCSQD